MISGMDGGAVANGNSRHRKDQSNVQRKRRRLEARIERGKSGHYTVHDLELLSVIEIVTSLKPYHLWALARLRAVTHKDRSLDDIFDYIKTCKELLHVKVPGAAALKLYRAVLAGRPLSIGRKAEVWTMTAKVLLAQHRAWMEDQRKNKAHEDGKL